MLEFGPNLPQRYFTRSDGQKSPLRRSVVRGRRFPRVPFDPVVVLDGVIAMLTRLRLKLADRERSGHEA